SSGVCFTGSLSVETFTGISIIRSMSHKTQKTQVYGETELLLCCARTRMEPDIEERIQMLLRESLDWKYLLARAWRNGFMPLLYHNLSAACPEAVPVRPLAQLRNHFFANAANSFLLTEELRKLLDRFETHGISAISYKGPVLAAFIYGNLLLRESGDLDI